MIGILALQGAFAKHAECLKKLGVNFCFVKHPEDLESCIGLILPGGETTVHLKLLHKSFLEKLKEFGQTRPIFGTCCGMILLASQVQNENIKTLSLMNMTVARNAYGRQVESFQDKIEVSVNNTKMLVDAFFIRAPQIVQIGPNIEVLAQHCGVPVLVQNELHMACSFHPEISLDVQLHQIFVQRCQSVALSLK